jgi:hypothetical protein
MNRIAIVFAAGFLAVLIGHQPMVAALNALGLMPPGFVPYSFDPVPPFGVPSVISKAFWGGLWAILLDVVLARASGVSYWAGWTILGAIALPLVAIFVVPPLKGLPVPPFADRMPVFAAVNAAWGFMTALLLTALRRS